MGGTAIKRVYIPVFFAVAAALTFSAFLLCGCKREYAPKPYGFPRIDRDSVTYVSFAQSDFPLKFDIPSDARAELRRNETSSVWIDISYPEYAATLYCTYIPLNGTGAAAEQRAKATEFVYLHASRASSIEAVSFEGEEIAATIYRLYGKVATPVQFVADDGNAFLLRGAFYFNYDVEPDSVAPVVQYVEEDVRRLVESLKLR